MTNPMTNSPTMSQPLLIAYVEALLPSLLSATKTSDTTADITQSDTTELLWVLQHQAELPSLRTQLHHSNNDHMTHAHLSTLQALSMQPMPQRYQLACFWLPDLSAELLMHYLPTLMRYRDLYAAHLLIALDETHNLQAYGFTPLDILIEEHPTLTLWQFNLYDYKKLPNWLNSDYWANPENWGKHRW